MPSNRIVYQDWIVEIGHDPDTRVVPTGGDLFRSDFISLDHPAAAGLSGADALTTRFERRELIRRSVSEALNNLDDDEREFVIRFHFMGESYRRIAEKSGRSIHKLEALHKRSLRRLKKQLAGFVHETFGLGREVIPDCPICRSPFAAELDEIIRNRDRTATWHPVLTLLKTRYNLSISSPQLLIGHEKYHSCIQRITASRNPERKEDDRN